MFDITSDEISLLNDSDLRELIGRLCEAELIHNGYSPAAVTWGGNQTAPDGGFDVRVALPANVSSGGFIQRTECGFQVKTPDMPRGAILGEMRPDGAIRSVIQELADMAGAYIIVSSHGSTTDSALRKRREAMREALSDVPNADQLLVDFYDRTRLATWVRQYPGLITWVKERIGRALVGWQPYGPWSGASEDNTAEYVLDEKLRLHLGKHHTRPAQAVADAIDEFRDLVRDSGSSVRLVGLSGVGKTRLVQALFDARIGLRPLLPSLAVYTNLSDNPDPQPFGLASDLIANRTRAVLIVDNCPPDLHHRLSQVCNGPGSRISVLTVEYDVRDDQPENTHVVILDTSSPELIEKLVERRYPHLSQVDARTIAMFSGGNARIAIALAETVKHTETIAGLTNDELFQRLFHQRHSQDNALLLAAQACSLVYSFHGEMLTGDEAEIPRLAALADQNPRETYRHINVLRRRDLVQERGVWRAVLPHALANRLAARALEDIPFELIHDNLIHNGTERLMRSFSRRLSFLHDHPKAVTIVERWLAPSGFLGDTTVFNTVKQAMFENIAPVLPEAALATLERVGGSSPEVYTDVWRQHLSLLRSLAYDAPLFVRSTQLIARVATQHAEKDKAKQASDTFISLFTVYLSGTHASIEQRLRVIEELFRSDEPKAQTLGLAALTKVLETMHFMSHYRFEFGARSRDYGYQPRTRDDIGEWYRAALALIERLALSEGRLKSEFRNLVAQKFRGLWTSACMYDELERLSLHFTDGRFWPDGWAACKTTLFYDRDRMSSESASRLSILETRLRPSNLSDRVRGIVLGYHNHRIDLDDVEIEDNTSNRSERLVATARELARAVVHDDNVFDELLVDLLRGGSHGWAFGSGLAEASQDLLATWTKLISGLEQIAPEERSTLVLRGYLSSLWIQDRDLANHVLDNAVEHPALGALLPVLQSAIGLDAVGITRLKRLLSAGKVPIRMYQDIGIEQPMDDVTGDAIKDLLLLIADQEGGFEVAVEILSGCLDWDNHTHRTHDPKLLETGQKLLQRIPFQRIPLQNQNHLDHTLACIAKACLSEAIDAPIIVEIARRLRQALAANETFSSANDLLLRALLEPLPIAVLDVLFEGNEHDQSVGIDMFDSTDFGNNQSSPADVIPCEALIAWCEADRDHRYLIAASIITFAHYPETRGPQVWSEQAKALLTHTPDTRSVLEVFIQRFKPNSWSGSRAAMFEANTRLLDSLDEHVLSSYSSFVTEAKARLMQEVTQMRDHETERDRTRDERFE